MERFELAALMNSVSWGSVFGGVVTVLAVSILLSILSTSIGLYMIKPQAKHPTSGVGTTVGIGTAIALIISMIAGGLVAGKLANADGMIHGFLVWATTLIIAVILGGMLTASAARMTANVFGSISSVVGHILSGVGSAVGDGASALTDKAKEMFGDIDFTAKLKEEDIPEDIRKALAKSDVKELHPDFLQNQLEMVKTDLGKSVKKIMSHPQDAENIITNFMNNLKERVSRISNNVDRNDLAKAIANNTDMSTEQANKAIDDYMASYNKVKQEAQEQMDNLEMSLQKAKREWNDMKEEALKAADKATNTAATSALISFFAILIAAILCAAAGTWGANIGYF
ncbi:hypothetical protein [uncultured Bacteroides sp.]|uniref:hypothetical protein n=1 Tax=uncultured Bacteroides sp. TaxID=162156 RepID=UPI0025F99FD3|nr:hypothetical protein [uncultured Bacteroides sp.]